MKKKNGAQCWFRMILLALVTTSCATVHAWSQTVLSVGPGQTYSTIQAAVNAANTGDGILVYPSTYQESVSVTKNGISIVAQGSGVTVDPSPVEGVPGFNVMADGVVIHGFNITGISCTAAIEFEGSHNRFSSNRIYGLTCPGVNGIMCRDPKGGSNYNVIENNDVTNADLGIVVNSDSATVVNKGNIITGNYVHGVGALGVAVYNGVESYVTGNVIDGIPFGPGISIGAQNSNVPQHSIVVTGNTISNTSGWGIGVFANQTTNLTKVTVSNNNITSISTGGTPYGNGILLQKDSGAYLAENLISDNSISQAQVTGILVDSQVNKNKVKSNVILNSGTYGINVNGNQNEITLNTVLESGTDDLANGGKNNQWWNNIYKTASW